MSIDIHKPVSLWPISPVSVTSNILLLGALSQISSISKMAGSILGLSEDSIDGHQFSKADDSRNLQDVFHHAMPQSLPQKTVQPLINTSPNLHGIFQNVIPQSLPRETVQPLINTSPLTGLSHGEQCCCCCDSEGTKAKEKKPNTDDSKNLFHSLFEAGKKLFEMGKSAVGAACSICALAASSLKKLFFRTPVATVSNSVPPPIMSQALKKALDANAELRSDLIKDHYYAIDHNTSGPMVWIKEMDISVPVNKMMLRLRQHGVID